MPKVTSLPASAYGMALRTAALYIPGLIIRNADVVTKSYPEYWDHLRSIGFTTKEVDADTLLNNI